MKKFLSILLALALVLSLGTVAFATGGEPYTDHKTVTLTKNYKLTNNGTTSPAEIFTFTAPVCTNVENAAVGVNEGTAPKPTIDNVSFSSGQASNTAQGTVTITLPDYTNYGVGIYTYTFNEVNNGTAGVSYRSEPITLKVTVLQGETGLIRVPAIHAETVEGEKIGSFDNTYSAGSLAVKKVVTGNMGDQKKEFDVTVTFKAPTDETVKSDITYRVDDATKNSVDGDSGWTGEKEVKMSLHHDETITFTNIPYGVEYTVKESDYETSDGYTTTYTNAEGKIEADKTDATITNNKNVDVIDTGVFMDSLPYVLLLVGACAGLVVFLARRRMTHKG